MVLDVNGKNFEVLSLLGHGKGGYSYLVTDGVWKYVLKQIHHEPCDYYQFGDKLSSELADYAKLSQVGLNLPRLLDIDHAKERILKQFVEGETVFDLVLKDKMTDELRETLLGEVRKMCDLLYPANLNIDFFPTNFVLNRGSLFYIDYECNDYHDEWNFENWGIKYWSKTPEFLAYLESKK